ncbi:MAG: M20/M25/M40 family metallo-hydrolase [Armatimonadetes bacterium]|nr:M20/M25/M40 family metallo-hydrolase [Armatimonadota bacterium]
MSDWNAYVESHRDRFVEELQAFCRLPSVVAARQSIPETADFVAARMTAAGIRAEIVPVAGGSPAVLGEIGEGPVTVLIYGHYDVQPADPLGEWTTGPFDAAVRDGRVYARGVCDNKGPTMARIQAIEAWQRTIGKLPLRVRFLVEGEEEIGSPHLAQFVLAHRDRLACDVAIWEGNGRDAGGRIQASLGQKGLASFNLRVRSAKQDQHSQWGTLAPNALWRLVWALGTIKNANDELTIDGLLDEVRKPTAAENALLANIAFDGDKIIRAFGIRGFVRGLNGPAALAKHLFEPACTINGFWGGYTGPGGKTVLPAEANAKIDIRLVPDLVPGQVTELLRAHLDRRGFDDVEIEPVGCLAPFRCAPDHPLIAALLAAGEKTHGERIHPWPTSAGSGPMAQVCGPLGVPVISIGGMNHAGANMHGPDENIFLDDYVAGVRFACNAFAALAAAKA